MVDVGVIVRPQLPPEVLRAAVTEAEYAGVSQLWLWEDCFAEGGVSAAAAALAWSRDLTVGIGLLPVPLRNPALTAMEVATLARMFPGRVTVTLGHGVRPWMEQVGEGVDSPMTLLREHAAAVAALLRGEEVTVRGRYVQLDHVRLDWPPVSPPLLLIGARGPKTIALAAELTDGVLLDQLTDPEPVRAARVTVGDAHVALYTPFRPEESAQDLFDRIRALEEAGADTVVVHGTDDQPDHGRILSALADR
ncbi:MAG TPA: LLM class flavin-dependent oxidoreductase [Ornithinimicrobium sp.]|uniref:LLM class flavin-dependent oxidoreductase n=1 Tax=Ornithinimicrobium sp. TaxID=1977084 RepID=UPI002B48C22B|nr:LLM class flavin-dependent oxidoreductase [Ornithinimicrobium sp.]HKJ11842.1 LLM class flavin-dependent oxidoreductase [Ornithinimicrobium sp.]